MNIFDSLSQYGYDWLAMCFGRIALTSKSNRCSKTTLLSEKVMHYCDPCAYYMWIEVQGARKIIGNATVY